MSRRFKGGRIKGGTKMCRKRRKLMSKGMSDVRRMKQINA